MPAARTSIFISYSRADERWRKLVEKHLAPLGRDYKLRVWSDQNLLPGEPWLTRIKRELALAKVGILLVSANFMASDFIHSDELPPLLAAAKQEGVVLLTVVVGYCHFSTSPLSKLQTFNKPDKPLESLSVPQRNKEMARLCAKLMKLFGLKTGTTMPSGTAKTAAGRKTAAPKAPKQVKISPESITTNTSSRAKKTATTASKRATKSEAATKSATTTKVTKAKENKPAAKSAPRKAPGRSIARTKK